MCCIGNVNRRLWLLRARSGNPRLLEGELLEPWPQQRPRWFTAWIVDHSRRLEEAIRQPAVIYQVRPREPLADAGVQTRQYLLRPPRFHQAVEAIVETDHTSTQTARVRTRTTATQTSSDLIRDPEFLLGLLVTTRRPEVIPMTGADMLLASLDFRSDMATMVPPEDGNVEELTITENGHRNTIAWMDFHGWE
jgi:hypothetical protein